MVHVELKLAQREILCRENPRADLILTNQGNRSIQLRRPLFRDFVPPLRVLNLRNGREVLLKGRGGGEEVVEIRPGKAAPFTFPLFGPGPTLEPDEYEISAVVPYDEGARQAVSAPVRVKIGAITPRHLMLGSIRGLTAQGVWVNVAGCSPQLMLSRFSMLGAGRVVGTRAIAAAGPWTRPVPSLAPAGSAGTPPWVAWLERAVLRFICLEGAARVGTMDLSASDACLAAPLCAVGGARPSCAGVMWSADGEGRLQIVHLTPEKGNIGLSTRLSGSGPVWMMSHPRSKGPRSTTVLQSTPGGLTLSSVSWSERSIGPALKLATWPGDFVASGAMLGIDDAIRGGTLVRISTLGRPLLRLIEWEIDARGGYREGDHHAIPAATCREAATATVRVGAFGDVAAFLPGEGGEGLVYFRGRLRPVAPTGVPRELLFLDGREPVLLCADEGMGFRWVRPHLPRS